LEKYRKYLAETGWSEKVQDEWLETLWNIMATFVDLAWDTDPVQTVLKAERPSSSEKLQPMAQGTSNPHNVRKSLRKTGKRRRIKRYQTYGFPAVESAAIFEPLKFLAHTEIYEALQPEPQEVASLRRESSNQLLETLEEWNIYLERIRSSKPRTNASRA